LTDFFYQLKLVAKELHLIFFFFFVVDSEVVFEVIIVLTDFEGVSSNFKG